MYYCLINAVHSFIFVRCENHATIRTISRERSTKQLIYISCELEVMILATYRVLVALYLVSYGTIWLNDYMELSATANELLNCMQIPHALKIYGAVILCGQLSIRHKERRWPLDAFLRFFLFVVWFSSTYLLFLLCTFLSCLVFSLIITSFSLGNKNWKF